MAEVTKMQMTKSTIDGSSNLSGIIKEDDGSTTNFIIASENQGFPRIMGSLKKWRSGEMTDDDFAEVVRDAMSLANRIQKDIDRFAIPGLPITRRGNHFYVTVDGEMEPVDPTLERQMINASNAAGFEARQNWQAMSNFIMRLYQNTTRYVREQLFSWLKANFDDGSTHSFTIMPDGRFVGYKGCTRDEMNSIVSINVGHGFVNGKEYMDDHLPNNVGDVVSMPRGEVQDDPATGCSTGLHVGTYEYASQFANGVLVRVAVAPEDVVSIPLDCHWQKLRACRYEVLETEDRPVNEFLYGATDSTQPPFGVQDVINRLILVQNGDEPGKWFSSWPDVLDGDDPEAADNALDKAVATALYSDSWEEAKAGVGALGFELDSSEVDDIMDRLTDWAYDKVSDLDEVLEDAPDVDDDEDDFYDYVSDAVMEIMPSEYDGADDVDSAKDWLQDVLDSASQMESLYAVFTRYDDMMEE